jgi:hypothetical protein
LVVDATRVSVDALSWLPEVLFRPLFRLDVSFGAGARVVIVGVRVERSLDAADVVSLLEVLAVALLASSLLVVVGVLAASLTVEVAFVRDACSPERLAD